MTGFSYSDGVICKNAECRKLYFFSFPNGEPREVSFPIGDFSVVRSRCPHCFTTNDFKNEEIMHEIDPKDEETKRLRADNKVLKARVDELEPEITRLRKNNDILTEDNRILAHEIQELRTEKEKT